MRAVDVLATALRNAGEMVAHTLADFSDADMLVRPVDAANHAAWQLGHLVNSEHHMISMAGGKMPALPAVLAAWGKEQQAINDPARVPAKAALLAAYQAQRAATLAWVKTLADKDLADTRGGKLPEWAPTVGALLTGAAMHDMMHMGQMQVVRRKLGKPILF